MHKSLTGIGIVLLCGAGGLLFLAFDEFVTSLQKLTYMAVALGFGGLLLACGGMLMLGAAAILDQLDRIGYKLDKLAERDEDEAAIDVI